MKKIISVIVSIAMILSLLFVCMITASAAVEGDWDVYSSRGSYRDPDDPNKRPVPGYEYTEDGLHMIPADWSDNTPWGIFQTKEQVDLRQGVYMEVRIDNFTYEGDKWFGFNIWEEKIDEFPNESDKSAIGLEALVRIDANKKITQIPLNIHKAYGEATTTSGMNMSGVENEFDENGCPIVTLQITWTETGGYNVIVNGATLSSKDSKTMTDIFDGEDNDGRAYVSFSLQNSIKGGTAECTILKFGTSPGDCETPTGDDRAAPINNKIEIADIADPSTVPEGMPAIFINGSSKDSDLLSKPGSTNNSTITINDDQSINVKTTTSWASIAMSVANEVSYDASDFPIMMVITKNLCTCTWDDYFPSCSCVEMPTVITMAGDTIAADSANTIRTSTYIWEPYYDADDNMYSYCIADWSSFSGRINGFRFDMQGIRYSEEGRGDFDIVSVTFFRTLEEAQEYFTEYLIEIGVIEDDTVDPPTSSETESDDETEPGDETETNDDMGGEENSTEPTSDTQPKEESSEISSTGETESQKTESDKKEPGSKSSEGNGCGSAVGLGAMTVITLAMASFISFRKKED